MNKLKISQVQFQASHIPALNAETLEKSFNNTCIIKKWQQLLKYQFNNNQYESFK